MHSCSSRNRRDFAQWSGCVQSVPLVPRRDLGTLSTASLIYSIWASVNPPNPQWPPTHARHGVRAESTGRVSQFQAPPTRTQTIYSPRRWTPGFDGRAQVVMEPERHSLHPELFQGFWTVATAIPGSMLIQRLPQPEGPRSHAPLRHRLKKRHRTWSLVDEGGGLSITVRSLIRSLPREREVDEGRKVGEEAVRGLVPSSSHLYSSEGDKAMSWTSRHGRVRFRGK